MFDNKIIKLEDLLKKPIFNQEPNNKVIQTMNAAYTPITEGTDSVKAYANMAAFSRFLEKDKDQLTSGSIGTGSQQVINSAIMLG